MENELKTLNVEVKTLPKAEVAVQGAAAEAASAEKPQSEAGVREGAAPATPVDPDDVDTRADPRGTPEATKAAEPDYDALDKS